MGEVLKAARASLDGALPATIATVSASGVPNISYLSRVLYIDEERVAITNQFFRKTAANLAANPRAVILVVDPGDGGQHMLDVRFEESVEDGPIFEELRAELATVASLLGMTDVFVLKSAYVFRVVNCARLALPSPESSS